MDWTGFSSSLPTVWREASCSDGRPIRHAPPQPPPPPPSAAASPPATTTTTVHPLAAPPTDPSSAAQAASGPRRLPARASAQAAAGPLSSPSPLGRCGPPARLCFDIRSTTQGSAFSAPPCWPPPSPFRQVAGSGLTPRRRHRTARAS
ncbi:hypothetical protein CDD83_8055 [Cordyceps sp. RAO-2017]|nr:hypothetical protein CDD83_8055 [Cordyceps sp. RAO-2017]